MALRRGADAICEKPLVLNPWNVDALMKLKKNQAKNLHNFTIEFTSKYYCFKTKN